MLVMPGDVKQAAPRQGVGVVVDAGFIITPLAKAEATTMGFSGQERPRSAALPGQVRWPFVTSLLKSA